MKNGILCSILWPELQRAIPRSLHFDMGLFIYLFFPSLLPLLSVIEGIDGRATSIVECHLSFNCCCRCCWITRHCGDMQSIHIGTFAAAARVDSTILSSSVIDAMDEKKVWQTFDCAFGIWIAIVRRVANNFEVERMRECIPGRMQFRKDYQLVAKLDCDAVWMAKVNTCIPCV